MTKRKPIGPLERESEHVARAQKGDKDAYRYLVEGYQDRLYALIASLVGNGPQAEDLTQEVLVKAYFALPKFQGGAAFYTWLFRIASNHCTDFLRRKRAPEMSLDAPADESETLLRGAQLAAPDAESPEGRLHMPSEPAEALASLPAEYRLILTLRELQDYSYEELAEILRCNINTVKSRLSRAREALKAAFFHKFGNIRPSKNVQNKGEPIT